MFRRLAFSSAEPRPVQGLRPALPSHGNAGGAERRPGRIAPTDDLTPLERRGIVLAMLLLHLGAVAWLWLLPARAPLPQVSPVTLRVDWIAAPSPVAEMPLAPDPAPVPQKPTAPRPPTPQRQPVIAAPETPVPATMVTSSAPTLPTVDSTPAPVQAPPAPSAVVASPSAEAVAPPPPKTLPPEAVQYLVPPAPVYPKMSRRYGESGRVLVRVYIDEGGVPRSVQVTESSGHPRLDDAARTAVQATRFKPYAENGRPTAGWAFIPLTFDLEK